MALDIKPFDKNAHCRDDFSCTSDALNSYLKRQLSQDIRKNLCKAYVLLNDDRVIGFYTLSMGGLPKKLSGVPYPQVGGVLLGRLAVDRNHVGKDYGSALLHDALIRAYEWMVSTAGYLVYLEAKDQNVKQFYLRHGFHEVSSESLYVYLTYKELTKLYLDH